MNWGGGFQKIERVFDNILVKVTHMKGSNIVWTCVEDNIIWDKEDNREIGLCGFDYTLFEEKKDGGVREGINGYPYLKHLLELRPGD